MRARNMWIIAGIGAIAVLTAWWFLRGEGRRTNPDTDRGSAAAPTGSGTARTREPTRSIPAPKINPGEVQGGETVESVVARSLAATGARATAVECDEARCQITVEAPDDDDLSAAVTALEESLPKVATNLIVSAPTAAEGGGRKMVLTAELQ